MKVAFIALFGSILFFCLPAGGTSAVTQSSLSSDGQRIVDYLLEDWKKQFHSTGIPLAMQNLGIAPGEDLRLEVTEYFRANSNISDNLKWWGANNYILNNDEKRIAKQIMNTYRDDKRLPDTSELSGTLGIPLEEIKARLDFLNRAGLLIQTRAEPGYMLTEHHERWGGPMRHNFHTVTVVGEKPFDVW